MWAKLMKGSGGVTAQKLTSLSSACRTGDSASVSRLIQSSASLDLDLKVGRQPNALSVACENGHLEIVQILIASGRVNINHIDKDSGWTPLHYAARHGHTLVGKHLVDMGCRTMVSGRNGETPLHVAAMFGHTDLCVLLLRRPNMDCNAVDGNGQSPLHLACENGHADACVSLVKGGANANMPDHNGDTPAMWAVFTHREEVVSRLLETGAVNLRCCNNYGWSVMHIAAYTGDEGILTRLLEAYAEGGVPDYNCASLAGQTLLHAAVEGNRPEIVSFLINNGADPGLHANDGEAPLHTACKLNHVESVYALVRYEAVSLNEKTSGTAAPGFTPYQLAGGQPVREALIAVAIAILNADGHKVTEEAVMSQLVDSTDLGRAWPRVLDKVRPVVRRIESEDGLVIEELDEEDDDHGIISPHVKRAHGPESGHRNDQDRGGAAAVAAAEAAADARVEQELRLEEAYDELDALAPAEDDDARVPAPRLRQAAPESSSALFPKLTASVLASLEQLERKEYMSSRDRFMNPATAQSRSHHGYDIPEPAQDVDLVIEGGMHIPVTRPDTAYSNSNHSRYESAKGGSSRPMSASSNLSAYHDARSTTRPLSAQSHDSRASDYNYIMNGPVTGLEGPRITPDVALYPQGGRDGSRGSSRLSHNNGREGGVIHEEEGEDDEDVEIIDEDVEDDLPSAAAGGGATPVIGPMSGMRTPELQATPARSPVAPKAPLLPMPTMPVPFPKNFVKKS